MPRRTASSSFFRTAWLLARNSASSLSRKIQARTTSAQVEVATFRSDVGYSDGRHPDQVVYTNSPQEDRQAARFHDQRAAARSRNERDPRFRRRARRPCAPESFAPSAAPDDRFREDKLRMVRAVRFAARFRYAIEAATFTRHREIRPGIFTKFRPSAFATS